MSGYLLLANQHHTASDGQGSRDLCQTLVTPYRIVIVLANHRIATTRATIHKIIPLRIFNRLKKVLISIICEHPFKTNVKRVVRNTNVSKGLHNKDE